MYNGIMMGFLDNDTYKFTMQQIVLHRFPNVNVEYKLVVRSNGLDVKLGEYYSEIETEIAKLKDLSLTKDESDWVRSIRYFSDDYVDFLDTFRYNPEKYVNVGITNGRIEIVIVGPWLQTILFEIPILAILSDLSSKISNKFNEFDNVYNECIIQTNKKADEIIQYDDFKLADFGTRRRFSARYQDTVVRILNERLNIMGKGQFVGTSNIHLAKKYNISPIGTQAHEYLQAFQVLSPLYNHLSTALDYWNTEYKGDLGIALTDSITTDVFLKEFNLKFAKQFDGVRHDSGDPFEFGNKIIEHYKSLNISPITKTIVFSDGLNIKLAIELYNHFNGKIKVSFGIGTHLSNDVKGYRAPSIVIKMISCQGFPVAKISDNSAKSISKSRKYMSYIKDVYNIEG